MPSVKHRLVGTVSFTPLGGKDGRIRLEPGWEAANIVTVHIPQLKGVDVGGGKKCSGNIKWFKGGVYQLKEAFKEVEAAGLKHLLLTYAGSFYPRMIRGSTRTPSEHSFGTAFDINVAWNGLNREPAARGTKGSVRELVPIFEKWGFRWGGYFRRADGMHFELARLIPEGAGAVASVPVAPQSLILVRKGKAVRLRTKLDGGANTAPVRDVLKAAGLAAAKTGTWKDGTTVLYLGDA